MAAVKLNAAGLIALAAAATAEHAAAGSLPPRIDLGAAAVEVALAPPAPGAARRCFVVVEGLTAERPVGTAYELALAVPGEAPLAVGAISFFDAIGLPLAAHGPLGFEVPARYCTAPGVVARLRPLRPPNPAARPAVGRVVLRSE
jgi:hypothetical protein